MGSPRDHQVVIYVMSGDDSVVIRTFFSRDGNIIRKGTHWITKEEGGMQEAQKLAKVMAGMARLVGEFTPFIETLPYIEKTFM